MTEPVGEWLPSTVRPNRLLDFENSRFGDKSSYAFQERLMDANERDKLDYICIALHNMWQAFNRAREIQS